MLSQLNADCNILILRVFVVQLENSFMFTKIAFLGAASLLAIATSVTSYMGSNSQGSSCQKMAMVSTGCCSTATSCCANDLASAVSSNSPCECASCACSACLPDDCCCNDCCADGACCDGGTCDSCGESAAKLVSTPSEPCSGGCCAKK